MKFVKYLDDILGQKSKVSALRYLINMQDEVSIRELSRHIKITQPNLSIVLKDLERMGVLVSKKFGTSLVFKLNRGHYLVDNVLIPLFKSESRALNEMSGFIVKKIKFEYISIILFGSMAHKSEHFKSDIDIIIIINDKHDKEKTEMMVLDINPEVIKKFGNSLSPIVMTKSEFVTKYKNNEALVRNISKEGKILAGKLISEIL